MLIAAGIFYYLHVSKEEKYSTANPELRRIPDIQLSDSVGKMHRLDELKEPGIVVFWASWCGPCIDELNRLETQDLGKWSYLAINSADKRDDALKLLAKEKVTKPMVLFDDDQKIGDIKGYPTVYVSFRNGFWGGPMKSWRFDEVIKEAQSTLAKADFRPYQESPERLKKFRESSFWRFYYSAAYVVAPVYFLILLFFLRKQVRGTSFLRSTLLVYTIFSVAETFDWRFGTFFNSQNLFPTIIRYIYYSPFFWGGLITLGILIYLKQFLPRGSTTLDGRQR